MTELYHYDPKSNSIVEGKLEFAIDNMKHLLTDVDVKGTRFSRVEEFDRDGYFGFIVWRVRHAFSILMPGSPLEYIRDINRYPRMEKRPIEIGIYEGKSWCFWSTAVSVVQDEMQGKGYNPYIEELEFKIDKLEEELVQCKNPEGLDDYEIFERTEIKPDHTKDIILEIEHIPSKKTGYFNLEKSESEGASIIITSVFGYTVYGEDIDNLSAGDILYPEDGFTITRIK